MDLFKLRVRDLLTGKIYKFTSDESQDLILEVHYSTSYFQFVVQDTVIDVDGHSRYNYRDLCYILDNANPIDLIAIDENEHCEIYFE